MRITISPTYNNDNKICTTKIQQNVSNAQNISFGAVAELSGLIYKAYLLLSVSNKTAKNFHTCKQVTKVKQSINTLYNDLNIHPYAKAEIMSALSKMRSGIDNSAKFSVYNFFRQSLPSVSEMKKRTLTELIYQADDSNGYERNAKKDFITSLYNYGEYLSQDFINVFKNLSDVYYKTFKEDIADKAIYGVKKYLPSTLPEQYIYNYEIVKALNNGNHYKYLVENKDGIKNLLHSIYSAAKKKITSKRNLAYTYYSYDGNKNAYLDISNYDLWTDYSKIAFNTALFESKGDSVKLASSLNIDKYLADDIIKDYQVLDSAQNTLDKDKKLEIYKQRLNDKFKFIVPGENTQRNSSKLYKAIYCKYKNILNFINKTELKEELEDIYKEELSDLYCRYGAVYDRCTRDNDPADDNTFLDYIRMHSGF